MCTWWSPQLCYFIGYKWKPPNSRGTDKEGLLVKWKLELDLLRHGIKVGAFLTWCWIEKKANSKWKEQCYTKYLSKCLKTWKIDVYMLLQEWQNLLMAMVRISFSMGAIFKESWQAAVVEWAVQLSFSCVCHVLFLREFGGQTYTVKCFV